MTSCDQILDQLCQHPPRRIVQRGDSWRRAAVASIFRQAGQGVELLFIQRAHSPHDPWSGQLGFPGGREEDEDVDLAATARRETSEELGLDLGQAALLGPLDELQARNRGGLVPLSVHPFAFCWSGPVPPLRLGRSEVDDAFWVPLEQLHDPARRTWYDSHRDAMPWLFPGIDLGPGRVLWGLTFRMVLEMQLRMGLIDDVEALFMPRPRS